MRSPSVLSVPGVAIAVLLGVAPALAGDPWFSGNRWSGFYLGGSIGHHNIKTEGVYDAIERGVLPTLEKIGDKGTHGSAHAGFMAQWGMGVVGVEGDYGFGGFRRSFDAIQDGSSTEAFLFSYPISGDLDYLATLRARAGIALDVPMTNGMLFYLTAGRAFTKFNMDVANGRAKLGFRESGTVVGAGAEIALTHKLSMRAEYMQFNFGKQLNITDEVTSGIFDANDGNYVKLGDVRVWRVGASYKLFP